MGYKYDIALSFATENQELVEKVYHYLKQEGLRVFFAPAQECQSVVSAEHHSDVFYNIFGSLSIYAALFVSKDYIKKEVTMEEASIAFAKHCNNGTVVPIYIDGTGLPESLFNPKRTNYFSSNNAAMIAVHLTDKVKASKAKEEREKIKKKKRAGKSQNIMNVTGNIGTKQVFIQEMKGNIK